MWVFTRDLFLEIITYPVVFWAQWKMGVQHSGCVGFTVDRNIVTKSCKQMACSFLHYKPFRLSLQVGIWSYIYLIKMFFIKEHAFVYILDLHWKLLVFCHMCVWKYVSTVVTMDLLVCHCRVPSLWSPLQLNCIWAISHSLIDKSIHSLHLWLNFKQLYLYDVV